MDYYPPDAIVEHPGSILAAIGSFWVRCPYNQRHKALNTQFRKHVERCRANYVAEQKAVRGSVNSVACKYNANHLVYPPELRYHEHSCPDRMTQGDVQTHLDSTKKEPMEMAISEYAPVQQLSTSSQSFSRSTVIKRVTSKGKEAVDQVKTRMIEPKVVTVMPKVLLEEPLESSKLDIRPSTVDAAGGTQVPHPEKGPKDDPKKCRNEDIENAECLHRIVKQESEGPPKVSEPALLMSRELERQQKLYTPKKDKARYKTVVIRQTDEENAVIFPEYFEVEVSDTFFNYGMPHQPLEPRTEAEKDNDSN